MQERAGTGPIEVYWKKCRSDRDEKLKTIFTDDQYKKFKNEIEPTLRPQRQQGQGMQSQWQLKLVID